VLVAGGALVSGVPGVELCELLPFVPDGLLCEGEVVPDGDVESGVVVWAKTQTPDKNNKESNVALAFIGVSRLRKLISSNSWRVGRERL
jgi:hypothetical protein